MYSRFKGCFGASLLALALGGCLGGGSGLLAIPTSGGGSTVQGVGSGQGSGSTNSTTTTTAKGGGATVGNAVINVKNTTSGTTNSYGMSGGTVYTPSGRAGLAVYSITSTNRTGGSSLSVYKFSQNATNRVDAQQKKSSSYANSHDFEIEIDGLKRTFSNCEPLRYCEYDVPFSFQNPYAFEQNRAFYDKYTYGMIGHWLHVENTWTRHNLFVSGEKSRTIPSRAKAYYFGRAMYSTHDPLVAVPGSRIAIYHGALRMNADFGTGQMNAVMDQFRQPGAKNPNRTVLQLNGRIYGNQIAYDVSGGVEANGQLIKATGKGAGYFYGPDAREVGGAFVIKDGNGTAYANAAFYGRR